MQRSRIVRRNLSRPSGAAVVVAAVLLALMLAPACIEAAPQEAGDFKAKLDAAIAGLSTYDFGEKTEALSAVADLVAATNARPAERRELMTRLAAVLASGSPRGAKDFVCRQFSAVGTASEVPSLAPLLVDANLSHMARYALERIPGPASDAALRQALGKVQGKLLIGIINSLGNRHESNAVGDLAKFLGNSDPAVATAAAGALGKIGPAAADALSQALASASAPVRTVAADSCVLCADQLAAQGKRDEAVAIYDRVRGSKVSKAACIAAIRGAIMARQAAGVPLLIEQLKAADPDQFNLALFLVRRSQGAEITLAVAAELAHLDAEKQMSLIRALGDRGDRVAAPAVLRLAKDGDAKVRAVAIQALARLSDASLVPVLLDLAANGAADLAQAAGGALASLPGKDVDLAILAGLGQADAKIRLAAIEALGRRHAVDAATALLKASADAEEPIRLAAIKALGESVPPQEFVRLVDLLVKAKEARQRAAWESAVSASTVRMPDRDPTAAILVSAMAQADLEGKASLLRVLGQVRGAKALEAVQTATKDSNEEIRIAAVRVLTNWPDVAAAPALIAIAKAAESPKFKILALRGYVRLIGLREVPAGKKLAMCREAMGVAQQNDEKKLVLGALGGVQQVESLAMVVPSLDNPDLKEEAAVAAVSIGDKQVAGHPAEVAAAMKKVLQVSKNASLLKRAQTILDRSGKK